MKLVLLYIPEKSIGSHLARGAWIEMLQGKEIDHVAVSHLARGAWIEIEHTGHEQRCRCRTSQEVRGFEISQLTGRRPTTPVAPRKRCVD